MKLVNSLLKDFNELQLIHGEKILDPIYGSGYIDSPDTFFIFMNPTGRNTASFKQWTGLKAPWIGTKNIWKLFHQVGLFDKKLFNETQKLHHSEWDYEFTNKVYEHVYNNRMYITNIAKCTQLDARPISNKVYKEYLSLLEKEIDIVKPKKIITFGNQVSSVFLEQPISVSKVRKTSFKKEIEGNSYDIYPVYYPVGQGMRNIKMAIEDIKWVIDL